MLKHLFLGIMWRIFWHIIENWTPFGMIGANTIIMHENVERARQKRLKAFEECLEKNTQRAMNIWYQQ